MKTTGKIALLLVTVMLFTTVLCSCGGGSMNGAVENPIKLVINQNVSLDKFIETYTNGLFASELKSLVKIASKMDDYEDVYDDFEDDWEDQIDYFQDEYGKNLKVTVKFDDKDEMKSKDLKSYQETFRGYGDTLKDYVKAYNKLDKDDIEDIADELGVKKSDLDSAVKYMDTIATALKKCEVKAGYELEVTATIKGSDDEDETENTYYVIKIGSNWICPTFFRQVYNKVLGYYYGLTRYLK